MRIPAFKKDTPIDENRIGHIETIIARMCRRLHAPKTVAVITPHAISGYASGDIYKEILSIVMFKGKVGKALIYFDKRPKHPIRVDVKILTDDEGFTRSFYVSTIRSMVDMDIETEDGSVATVSVHPTVEESIESVADRVSKVWLSVLWTPHTTRTERERILIEESKNYGGEE